MSKRLRWARGNTSAHFSLALPVIFLSLAAKPGPSASELLRKAFDTQFKHQVELVQLTATPSDPGAKIFKLYNQPGKGTHVNLLSPTVLSGTRSVDNRKDLHIYFPTSNEKTIQASPYRFRLPTDKRVKMIERNFTLSVTVENEPIALRDVYRINLKAKYRGVGNRYLFVDKEKGIILRSVLHEEASNKNFMLLETLSANFKVPKKPTEFDLPKVHTTSKWGPVNLSSFPDAEEKLGFEPRIPTTIPSGFEITHRHVVGKPQMPIFACRLSDGMNFITVYQWNPKVHRGESPFQSVKTTIDTYGIRYYAEGDAPKSVQNEVLRTFYLR